LKLPPPSLRTKVRHIALLHPRDVTERIGASYHVLSHDSSRAVEVVRSFGLDLGIITGARILKKPLIEAFGVGVINFHPGLIPEARGLDALLWSIHRDVPLGVTAHLIDERVDAGTVLLRRQIPVYQDDTFQDLSERLYETQLEVLTPAIKEALRGGGVPVDPDTPYNRKMPTSMEQAVGAKVGEYVRRYSAREFCRGRCCL
jgi:methionyl-tRNA formyltransferase